MQSSELELKQVMKIPAGFITERDMSERTGKCIGTLRRWAELVMGQKGLSSEKKCSTARMDSSAG